MTYKLVTFYKDKNALLQAFSYDLSISQKIIESAVVKQINIANAHSKCCGSFDDGSYIYEDGSKDFGTFANYYASVVKLYNDSGDILIFETGWMERI